jgi:hypothetical protein
LACATKQIVLDRRLRVVLALGITLGAARTARAELRVERGEGADTCPDAASFAERMREGGAESQSRGSDLTVRFERTASGFRSWIRRADGKRRTLTDDAPSCDGLAEATLLAATLTLELETAAPPPSPAPAPEPPAIADSAPIVPRAHRAPRAEISAGSVVAFGLTSPVAPGVRTGAAFVLGQGRWSLGISGVVLPAQTRTVQEGSVDVSMLGGGLEGCSRLPVGSSFLLAFCGRVEAARLEGTSHGYTRSKEEQRPLFSGTGLGRARVRLAGPIAAFVEAGAVIPFVRERFSIDTVGVVYDPPAVALATGIGILVDFE